MIGNNIHAHIETLLRDTGGPFYRDWLNRMGSESVDWNWPPNPTAETRSFGGFGGDTSRRLGRYGATPPGRGPLPRDPITGQLR